MRPAIGQTDEFVHLSAVTGKQIGAFAFIRVIRGQRFQGFRVLSGEQHPAGIDIAPQTPFASGRKTRFLGAILAAPASSTLTGVVERIVFLNEENHYTIAEFRPDSGPPRSAPVGRPRSRAARPAAPSPTSSPSSARCPAWSAARRCTSPAEWVRHAQHGETSSRWPRSSRSCRRACMAFASTSAAAWCRHRQGYANKIVDVFGTDTLRVLSEESAGCATCRASGPSAPLPSSAPGRETRRARALHLPPDLRRHARDA